jgi:hypothetical protein
MNKQKVYVKKMFTAFRSRPVSVEKDIHAQLAETINERNKILVQWEQLFHPRPVQKNIHGQLQETIAQLLRNRQKWGKYLQFKNDTGLGTKFKKQPKDV